MSAAGRRILMFTDRVPGFDTGYGMRVANVIDGLAAAGELCVCLVDSSRRGASLELSGPYDGTTLRASERRRWRKVLEVLVSLPNIRYQHQDVLRAIVDEAFGRSKWDLVWCSRARTHVLTADLIPGPRVVDFDDLNDRLARTRRHDRRARNGAVSTAPLNAVSLLAERRWRRLQHRIAAEVAHVAVCSEADREHLGVPNAVIVPNGYPDPGVRWGSGSDGGRAPERPVILFVGPLTYEPNTLAVKWFANDILPTIRRCAPQAEFEVIGRVENVSSDLLRVPGLLLRGHVPDVTPYYERAVVAVAPLHSGGGTRLKVIEALARGVPLVSTSFAVDGLCLRAGEEVLIADGPAEFAAACLALIRDADLRSRVAVAGLTRFASSLTARHCADAVRELATRAMAVEAPLSSVEGGRS